MTFRPYENPILGSCTECWHASPGHYGWCSHAGGIPQKENHVPVTQPFPFSPEPPRPAPPTTTPQQHYGWVCPKCQTANRPSNSTCGNPLCAPLKLPGSV